jgi:hypothetical protein
MPLSNYRHGFPNKVTIREFPIMELQNGNGNVFWVDSNKGSDGNKGTFDRPFATLDYAIGRCTANQGDKIFLAANHAETIIAAGTITADIAGIQIIGLGTGDDRPTVTATTDAAATFLVSADDVYIANIKFACNITSQVTMLDCNAARTIVEGCRFEEGTQTGLTFIDVNGGAANACDGVEIRHSEFYAPTAGNMNAAIELGEVADNVKIVNNWIYGDFDDAGIHNPTGKTLTHLSIENNIVANLLTGQHAIEIVSACTGVCVDNKLYGDTEAAILDPGSLKCIGNQAVDAIDSGSFELPYAADNSGNYIGTNSNNNDAATNLVVANADGSVLERLEYIQGKEIPDLEGLVYSGTCDTGMTGSTTTIVCAELNGYGDDSFNTKYYMQIIKNANSVGNAPETQVRQITDYVSTTGTFTVTAFGANVEEGDKIMVIHECLITLGRNDANNVFDSSTVVANADGSILERLEDLRAKEAREAGLGYVGVCDTGMTGSTTTIVSANFIGLGDDYFNTKYYMQVVKNANSVGNAPETQVRQITDFVSATGTFTVTAFGANVEEDDSIIVIHESLITLGRDDADNVFDSSTVVANADGSVLERLEYGQVRSELIQGLIYRGACDSGMGGSTTAIVSADLAGFGDDYFNTKYYMQVTKNANSVGNSPEPEVRQITDYVSATGTFTVTAFGANVEETDEILVIHESIANIGRDDNSNGVVTTNVASNADGSVLERLEYLQAAHVQNGTDLMIEKTLVSSAIPQAGVDITGVATGPLEILGITLNTDATGLAGGTNLQIVSDNDNGQEIIFEETIASLGGNQTENLGSGGVVSRYGIVLETGKKIIAQSTVADCTGAGEVDITIRFKRVTDGASVAAA